jgi:hypothetical protein
MAASDAMKSSPDTIIIVTITAINMRLVSLWENDSETFIIEIVDLDCYLSMQKYEKTWNYASLCK